MKAKQCPNKVKTISKSILEQSCINTKRSNYRSRSFQDMAPRDFAQKQMESFRQNFNSAITCAWIESRDPLRHNILGETSLLSSNWVLVFWAEIFCGVHGAARGSRAHRMSDDLVMHNARIQCSKCGLQCAVVSAILIFSRWMNAPW